MIEEYRTLSLSSVVVVVVVVLVVVVVEGANRSIDSEKAIYMNGCSLGIF